MIATTQFRVLDVAQDIFCFVCAVKSNLRVHYIWTGCALCLCLILLLFSSNHSRFLFGEKSRIFLRFRAWQITYSQSALREVSFRRPKAFTCDCKFLLKVRHNLLVLDTADPEDLSGQCIPFCLEMEGEIAGNEAVCAYVCKGIYLCRENIFVLLYFFFIILKHSRNESICSRKGISHGRGSVVGLVSPVM